MTVDEESIQVLRAAQRGNAQAFEHILDRHYSRIYRFAYRWSGNRADAEDITQQACLKLARSIKQFSFRASFTSWLYRLVVNCALDWQRSQHRNEHVSEGEPGRPIDPVEPENNTGNNDHEAQRYLEQVLGIVRLMGEGYLETLLLVCAEGFSHGEAADILKVKESTVSWRVHEVRRRLKILKHEEAQL